MVSMILKNQTTGEIICDNVKIADSFIQKTKGLINSNGEVALILMTRWGIHTFGMKFPIDVIILNKKNNIVRLKRNILPGKIFFWNPYFNSVIEIPRSLCRNSIKIGDKLVLI